MTKHFKNERGTVLLTTLLIMTIMAAITVALMEDIQLSVKRTINVQAYSQADWQADGAEDFVTAYLKNDFKDLPPIAKSALLQAKEPLILPTPDGAITLTLKDASQCFNLNALATKEGGRNDEPISEFIRLAELLGLPQNQAVSLANSLLDWQDKGQQQSSNGAEDGTYLRKNPPYRTADTSLRSPDELRAVHGMDEDLWELFEPFVCTGEAGLTPEINVNAMSGERIIILAAAFYQNASASEAVTVAQSILQNRPREGFSSKDQIKAAIEAAGLEGVSVSRLGVDVKSVFVEVVTQVGPAERARTYRYDNVDDDPKLTYRGWGRESFRPEIETQTESDTEGDAR